MKSYRQLKYEERVKIAELRQSRSSITQIAKAVGRSKSTILREIRRNQSSLGQYCPESAQNKALKRCRRQCRLNKDKKLREFVLTKLQCDYWAPEKIAECLKNSQMEIAPISHESIYAWIHRHAQKKYKLWRFLARHKAKRGRRAGSVASVEPRV
jgi:IS30 family transposase